MENDDLEKMVNEKADAIIKKMSPLDMGQLIYPDAVAVSFSKVPREIIVEHLDRYSKKELKRGQFFKVGDRYTFFMDKKAHEKRSRSPH